MRKETLIIETESPEARNRLLWELNQCIEFAGTGNYSILDILPSHFRLQLHLYQNNRPLLCRR